MTAKLSPPSPTCHVAAADLLPGFIIHPPARELSLWMRKHAAEHGLPAEWLTLTVAGVEPAKRPGYVLVRAHQPGRVMPWAFLAKSTTMWPVVSKAQEVRP